MTFVIVEAVMPVSTRLTRTVALTGLSRPGNLLHALKAHVRGFIVKDAHCRSPRR
jgi:hypothetical protein